MNEAVDPNESSVSKTQLTTDPILDQIAEDPYVITLGTVVDLMAAARHAASRSVNAIMTATAIPNSKCYEEFTV